jgi:hypothetical protein
LERKQRCLPQRLTPTAVLTLEPRLALELLQPTLAASEHVTSSRFAFCAETVCDGAAAMMQIAITAPAKARPETRS